jgi:hypothetical protein
MTIMLLLAGLVVGGFSGCIVALAVIDRERAEPDLHLEGRTGLSLPRQTRAQHS